MTLHDTCSKNNLVLYLDTSYETTWGIYDVAGNNYFLESIKNQKASKLLHFKIAQTCLERNIDFNHAFSYLLHSSGPGFYTGIRVSQVFSSIFKMGSSISSYSFYNFKIPYYLGERSYYWITKAYRGEVFVCTCIDQSFSTELYSMKEFLDLNFYDKKIFFHHEAAIDGQILEKIPVFQFTSNLMIDASNLIPSILHLSPQEQPFYFRPKEEEFRVTNV